MRGARTGRGAQVSDITMDTAARQVTRGGKTIGFTTREFDLLELFLRHPRQVLRRETIYDHVWGYDFEGESNVIGGVRPLRACQAGEPAGGPG